MKKLLVLSAIALLAACGGSDNKPANDPSINNATPAEETTVETPSEPAVEEAATPAPEGETPSEQPATE